MASEGTEAASWRSGQYRLGEYLIDPARNRIEGPEGEVMLQPKVMDVLCTLAGHYGAVLSRGVLIDLVWGVEHGADESLTRAISQIRKAFGDTRGKPRIVETIAKRGYRLVVPPRPVEDGSQPTRPATPRRSIAIAAVAMVTLALVVWLALRQFAPELPAAPSERTGIVVIVEPFASEDPALAAGLAEALSAEIARNPLVRAKTGDASGEPGLGNLVYRLGGTIRRTGETTVLDARLRDAENGEVVWSERFSQPSDRDAAIGLVTGELMLPLLRNARIRIRAKDVLALAPWELTLLVTWVPGDEVQPTGPPSEESYWLQRRALELDPDYAPAHALFAELAAYHALFDPPYDTAETRARAREHAERAFQLAPYDAEVLYQLSLYYRFGGDRANAAAMLDRVLDLEPNHRLAAVDRDFVRGQCAAGSGAAIASLRGRIDGLPASSPVRWVALSHLSSIHLARGEFDAARATALASRTIIAMPWTAITLAAADAATGRNAEAAQLVAEHRREWSRADLDYFADRIAPRWCLGGKLAPEVRDSFRALARIAGK